ncbi:MAG: DUF4911 domain-containing protein [Myxococcales bacterium]|nr:DUF4911 domain-containing protein [Myxococcales bacterium]
MSSAEAAGPDFGAGLTARALRVDTSHVVWLRSVLEAYDGLAYLYGDGSGCVWLVAPEERAAELDALIESLRAEVGPGALRTA